MLALKDLGHMQDICYYLHFDLRKLFFVGILGRWLLYIESLPGHCVSLCKVSAQTDKYYRNESNNRKTNKVLFEKSFLKVGL